MIVRVADYIIQQLYEHGVKHLFMVTGRGALFLTDAAAKHDNLSCICTHHEQAAAYAAVAYSQYNDCLGACLVSTGCAGTNAFTGVLNAWQDGIACVFISGQNTLRETSRFSGIPLRTFGQQEADLIPMVSPMTKYATMITDPMDIAYELGKAIHLADDGRKGPVWIDVPLDVQNKRIDTDLLKQWQPNKKNRYSPNKQQLTKLNQQINESFRPVVLIGSGVRSASAIPELNQFLQERQIPLVYAASAPDTYGTNHTLSIGSVGMMGCSRAGCFTIQNADLVIVLGCRLSPMTTGSEYVKFVRDANVIVIDIDPVEHSKNTININQFIHADVKQALTYLNQLPVSGSKQQPWRDKCQHWKDIFPKCEPKYKKSEKVDLYYLAESLCKTLPTPSVFVSDSGLIELILPSNIEFNEGRRCIHPAQQGCMGYALPAAIGAYYASKVPVIAVIGDGSIMMNLQELQTIKYHNLPIKILVVNNNAYAVIRKRQVDLFRSRTIGTDPSNGVSCPDFSQVAKMFNLTYVHIATSTHLVEQLHNAMNIKTPVLCEIMGIEDQEYIGMSHAKNVNKKIVRRPLEDQAPFMPRELFISEMVIEPIDL